eukprot:5487186-Karenia_brevis.AAC.1
MLQQEATAIRHQITLCKTPAEQVEILATALKKKKSDLEIARTKDKAEVEDIIRDLTVVINQVDAQLSVAKKLYVQENVD